MSKACQEINEMEEKIFNYFQHKFKFMKENFYVNKLIQLIKISNLKNI